MKLPLVASYNHLYVPPRLELRDADDKLIATMLPVSSALERAEFIVTACNARGNPKQTITFVRDIKEGDVIVGSGPDPAARSKIIHVERYANGDAMISFCRLGKLPNHPAVKRVWSKFKLAEWRLIVVTDEGAP